MEDVETIYAVPAELSKEGLDEQILRLMKLEARPSEMKPWLDLVHRMHHPAGEARIAVVGKYVQLEDAYKSLREALLHGGLAHNHKTVLEWIEAEDIDSAETAAARLHGYDGILVPGGVGKRGIQGMIHTIQYAREHRVPFFGICLGMQCATIEYTRDVAGMERPDNTEFLGCQFHPELKSKPLEPHPLFAAFIGAALENKKAKTRPAPEPKRAQAVGLTPHVTA